MTPELDHDNYRLRDLTDGYAFHIPDYQRFYSWTAQHCDDLWQDLLNVLEEDSQHYMGTLILKDEGNPIGTKGFEDDYREYAVVDGQQRLTTLAILAASIISYFEEEIEWDQTRATAEQIENAEQIVESTRKSLVRDTAIQSNRYGAQNRLRLQKEDNTIFKDILRGEAVEQNISKPSERRLYEAHNLFLDRIGRLGERQKAEGNFLTDLGRLLSHIQSLEFLVYVVEDRARATLIFESVNDRGKDLSRLDKTKSFLMHKHYLHHPADERSSAGKGIRDRFGHIYQCMQTIEEETKTSNIDEDQVQRFHYIAQIPEEVNYTYLDEETDRRRTLQAGAPVYLDALKWHFNRLYNEVNDGPHGQYPRNCLQEIDWYTKSLKRYYSLLADIADYDDAPSIQWELKKLFALGRVGNFYPLLLTVWDEYRKDVIEVPELHEILQTIEVVSFRVYAIGNKRSDTGRSKFYTLANKLGQGQASAKEIIRKLRDAVRKYEQDFEEALRNPNIYSAISNRDLRYLLYSYDLYIRQKTKGGASPGISKAVQNAGKDYSLDHVWPQDTSNLQLGSSEKEAHDELSDCLGNLTLTTGRRNASWKNKAYSAKRAGEGGRQSSSRSYENSDFASTRKIASDYDAWGREQIEDRLSKLVTYAKERWNLKPEKRRSFASIQPP